jgi:hypothetical protein
MSTYTDFGKFLAHDVGFELYNFFFLTIQFFCILRAYLVCSFQFSFPFLFSCFITKIALVFTCISCFQLCLGNNKNNFLWLFYQGSLSLILFSILYFVVTNFVFSSVLFLPLIGFGFQYLILYYL